MKNLFLALIIGLLSCGVMAQSPNDVVQGAADELAALWLKEMASSFSVSFGLMGTVVAPPMMPIIRKAMSTPPE